MSFVIILNLGLDKLFQLADCSLFAKVGAFSSVVSSVRAFSPSAPFSLHVLVICMTMICQRPFLGGRSALLL